jgi:hypothetical protein
VELIRRLPYLEMYPNGYPVMSFFPAGNRRDGWPASLLYLRPIPESDGHQ